MILLRPTPSWGCLCCPGSTPGPARASLSPGVSRHARAAGRAAPDRGRHAEAPCGGAPKWDTRERDVLDVRRETPDRQRGLAGGAVLQDRIGPEGGRREVEARAPVGFTVTAGPDPGGARYVPRRGSERENSHYTLGNPPPNDCRLSLGTRQSTGVCYLVASGISGIERLLMPHDRAAFQTQALHLVPGFSD